MTIWRFIRSWMSRRRFLGVERPETGEVDQLLKEGDVLRWGGTGGECDAYAGA